MPPPKTRKRPAAHTARPSRNTTNCATKFTAYRRQDGYAAPTAEDRAEVAVLVGAAEHGFRLTVQCIDCGNWLTNPVSVAAFRGARCRARARDGR